MNQQRVSNPKQVINQNLGEINPKTVNIDRLNTLEIIQLINQEDHMVALAINKVLPQISQVIDLIFARFKNDGRLIYVGAGSSGRIAMVDSSEIVPTFNVSQDKVITILAGGLEAFKTVKKNAEDNTTQAIEDLKALNLNHNDIVLGIAASGRTPYVLSALEYSKLQGCLTIGLCMSVYEIMSNICDHVINILTGAEVICGSTRMKAGTATKMVLNLISTALMIKIGKVFQNFMIDLKVSNQKLKLRAIEMLKFLTALDEKAVIEALEANEYICRDALKQLSKTSCAI